MFQKRIIRSQITISKSSASSNNDEGAMFWIQSIRQDPPLLVVRMVLRQIFGVICVGGIDAVRTSQAAIVDPVEILSRAEKFQFFMCLFRYY